MPKPTVKPSTRPAVEAAEVLTRIDSGYRQVRHVRCNDSTQIGPLGSSLDAKRNDLEMELRPDLGGVLIKRVVDGAAKEYVVPFACIVHVELLPDAKLVSPAEEEV